MCDHLSQNKMTYCECPKIHDYILSRRNDSLYFNFGDYCDAYVAEEIVRTKVFTENLDHVEVMCPTHHPFFYYLAGMVHLRPFEIHNWIEHAWNHKVSYELKIIVNKRTPERVFERLFIGLHKAWRIYCGCIASTTQIYQEDLRQLYTDGCGSWEEDECKSCGQDDGWMVMKSLGHLLWTPKLCSEDNNSDNHT